MQATCNFVIKSSVGSLNLHRCLVVIYTCSPCSTCEVRSSELSHQVSGAMECSKRFVAMGICVMLVLAFAAEVNAQCSLSALAPCYGAVQGAYPPRPNGGRNGACCRAVMVANPACLCSQMQQGRYPQNMIRNAFAMPRVCGRTNLRGYKCGSEYYWYTQLVYLSSISLASGQSLHCMSCPCAQIGWKSSKKCSVEKLCKFHQSRVCSVVLMWCFSLFIMTNKVANGGLNLVSFAVYTIEWAAVVCGISTFKMWRMSKRLPGISKEI